MNRFTCPSCESRIRLHRLLRSPIATWIRCPDCGRKLVGNYALQITDIVSTALLGAGLMVVFYFTAFLNTTFNNVIVLGAQSIAIAALATAALLLALGIVGLVIGRRWGRYEVHDESGRVPLVMRRYLAVVGVLSLVVVSIGVLYGGYRVGGVVLVTLVLSLALLLVSLYGSRLRGVAGPAVGMVLLVWAGAAATFDGLFVVYAVANVPKESAIQEQLLLAYGTPEQQRNWYRLIDISKRDDVDPGVLLDFFAENIVSIPEDEPIGPLTEIPRFLPLIVINENELPEIDQLASEGEVAAANERYVRLWTAADNMLQGTPMLITYLIANGIVSGLADYYGEGKHDLFEPSRDRLLEIVQSVEGRLDESFAAAMSGEYFLWRSIAISNSKVICAIQQGLDAASETGDDGCAWGIGWPFYDENKTIRQTHEFYSDLARISKLPPYLAEVELDVVTAKAEALREQSVLRNPFGSSLLALSLPLISRFAMSAGPVKTRLTALRYIMELPQSGSLAEGPVDPSTGEPIVVRRSGDRIEVSPVERDESGEPAFVYWAETEAE